ncbi:MAG TPA: hypothetical protein VLB44_15945 [Kofleriaceae bacterium]|nr:hypothetical protein [Kofleriaceae bacterium]
MRLAFVALLVACGAPPARKPPPAELPADKVADLAGRWVTNDEMDFGYAMTIDAAGVIDVWIDRGKLGRCEQKGTIAAHASRTFRVTYTIGECNPQAVNVPIDMMIASFTGASLTVVVADQSRTYQRAGEPEAGSPAPVQLH